MEPPPELTDLMNAPGVMLGSVVAVELELFFTGNQDPGSIAPNLIDHPGTQQIYEVLHQLRSRPDVSAVMVLVLNENEPYADVWPYAQSVVVVTSAPLSEIDDATAIVDTDPAFEVADLDVINPPTVPAGQRYVIVWWD